ncbi:MAG: hypothetical protein QF752_00875 [Planctomycetota bacterium]|nr:hypothetical protein [Planctomycetota bacterium]
MLLLPSEIISRHQIASLLALAAIIAIFLPGFERAKIANGELDAVRILESISVRKLAEHAEHWQTDTYNFRFRKTTGDSRWQAIAWPRFPGKSGLRAFFVISGGVIHYRLDPETTPPDQYLLPLLTPSSSLSSAGWTSLGSRLPSQRPQ